MLRGCAIALGVLLIITGLGAWGAREVIHELRAKWQLHLVKDAIVDASAFEEIDGRRYLTDGLTLTDPIFARPPEETPFADQFILNARLPDGSRIPLDASSHQIIAWSKDLRYGKRLILTAGFGMYRIPEEEIDWQTRQWGSRREHRERH